MTGILIWEDSRQHEKNGKMSFEHYKFTIEDGMIRRKKVDNRCVIPTPAQNKEMKNYLEELGYKPKVWTRTTETFVTESLLSPMAGHTVQEFEDHVAKMAKKMGQTRKFREKADGDWKRLKDRFDGVILGLDKVIDIYEEGFSIRIILKSTASLDERREFVKKKKGDIARWVCEDIASKDELVNQIGNINDYAPKELLVLKIPELEIKFLKCPKKH